MIIWIQYYCGFNIGPPFILSLMTTKKDKSKGKILLITKSYIQTWLPFYIITMRNQEFIILMDEFPYPLIEEYCCQWYEMGLNVVWCRNYGFITSSSIQGKYENHLTLIWAICQVIKHISFKLPQKQSELSSTLRVNIIMNISLLVFNLLSGCFPYPLELPQCSFKSLSSLPQFF